MIRKELVVTSTVWAITQVFKGQSSTVERLQVFKHILQVIGKPAVNFSPYSLRADIRLIITPRLIVSAT